MTQNITIDESRKLLGKKAESMTDGQIKAILDFLYSLSTRAIINSVGERNHNG